VRPKIVGEEKKEVKVKNPPEFNRIRRHFWMREESIKPYNECLEKIGFLPMYLSKKAEEKIRNHSMKFRDKKLEVMGFLLGDIYTCEGKKYSLVKDTVTGGLDTSQISVKFGRKGFTRLFESLDDVDFDYVIVGWYHSHPGHTCFMSKTDVATQKTMFREPYHSSIVIDPVNMEIEAYGLAGDECIIKPFAVYWDEYEDPYGKMSKAKFKKNAE
jgi:proteasome lid subunit RPN8/RPN11